MDTAINWQSFFLNQFIWDALIACLLLSVLLGYFGIFIVKKRIIFIDLAIAQSIALGTVIASLWNNTSVIVSILAALVSINLLFLLSKIKSIPQEALTGLLYAGSAALALVLVAKMPRGDADIMNIFFGNILTINYNDLYILLALSVLIAVAHKLLWKQLMEILEGVASHKWANYIFYISLGLVIAFSIKIAGVLLIFNYLIASAVSSIQLFSKRLYMFGFSILFNILGSLLGIILSYFYDLPTGATIVCCLIGFVVTIILLKVAARQEV